MLRVKRALPECEVDPADMDSKTVQEMSIEPKYMGVVLGKGKDTDFAMPPCCCLMP